jgi:hypothetical protein
MNDFSDQTHDTLAQQAELRWKRVKSGTLQQSNIHAATRASAGTFFRGIANLKRYVTTPANLDCKSNVVMTSTEISHVALQYYTQFKFCRCSIACEISHESHIKQCKQPPTPA